MILAVEKLLLKIVDDKKLLLSFKVPIINWAGWARII